MPILVGDAEQLQSIAAKHANLSKVKIIHAPDTVPADARPSSVLRAGKNTSMRQAFELVHRGEADAVVSCGNTGAMMALALFVLKTLNGIERPALAAYLPTTTGYSVMLDLGANIETSAEQLVQSAIMGEALYRITSGGKAPSIGLLNVGEEEQKGSARIKEAANILSTSESDLDYFGFVEGDDITKGIVDVIVSDGFSGNIALKTAEGMANFIMRQMKDSLKSSLLAKIGYLFARPALKHLQRKLDPQRYNGAVLLGMNGIVVKSHGGAQPLGIANAIGIASSMLENDFMDELKTSIQRRLISIDQEKEEIE